MAPHPGHAVAGRRADVVQIFPNVESISRLDGALLVEANDVMITADLMRTAGARPAAGGPGTGIRQGQSVGHAAFNAATTSGVAMSRATA